MSDYVPDEATAREDLCRFLSACYYEPAPEFAEEKLFNSMEVAARRLHPDLGQQAHRLGDTFAAHDLQTLLVDYTRLFIGPAQVLAKPYGSFWLSQQSNPEPDPAAALLDLYREGGFEIDESFQELPDHVAVELEFLYLLNFSSNPARAAGRMDEVAAAKSLKRRLLGEHLGAWFGPFAATVKASAETAFYRELANFTERFLAMEASSLARP